MSCEVSMLLDDICMTLSAALPSLEDVLWIASALRHKPIK